MLKLCNSTEYQCLRLDLPPVVHDGAVVSIADDDGFHADNGEIVLARIARNMPLSFDEGNLMTLSQVCTLILRHGMTKHFVKVFRCLAYFRAVASDLEEAGVLITRLGSVPLGPLFGMIVRAFVSSVLRAAVYSRAADTAIHKNFHTLTMMASIVLLTSPVYQLGEGMVSSDADARLYSFSNVFEGVLSMETVYRRDFRIRRCSGDTSGVFYTDAGPFGPACTEAINSRLGDGETLYQALDMHIYALFVFAHLDYTLLTCVYSQDSTAWTSLFTLILRQSYSAQADFLKDGFAREVTCASQLQVLSGSLRRYAPLVSRTINLLPEALLKGLLPVVTGAAYSYTSTRRLVSIGRDSLTSLGHEGPIALLDGTVVHSAAPFRGPVLASTCIFGIEVPFCLSNDQFLLLLVHSCPLRPHCAARLGGLGCHGLSVIRSRSVVLSITSTSGRFSHRLDRISVRDYWCLQSTRS